MDEKKYPEETNQGNPTEAGAVGMESNNVEPVVQPTQPSVDPTVVSQEPTPSVVEPIQPTMPNPTPDPVQPDLGGVSAMPEPSTAQPNVDPTAVPQEPTPSVVEPIQSTMPNQPDLGGTIPPQEPTNPAASGPEPKKNTVPFVLLGAILVLVIGLFGFTILNSNPKRIIINSIKTGKESLDKEMDGSPMFDLGKDYTVKGDMKLNVSSDLFTQGLNTTDPETQVYAKLMENLNKVDFQYEYAQDVTNKKLAFDMNASLNQEPLFQMTYYNENNKQYVFLGKLLDKWIGMEDYNIFETLDNEAAQEDLDYVYNVVIKSLNKNLDKDYFKTEKATIQLNGKDEKVDKTMLVLDNKKANTLIEKVITDIQNDKKANDIVVKNSPEFKEYKFKETEILTDNQMIIYSVYTKGLMKEVVKYQLEDQGVVTNTGIMYTKNTTPVLEIYQNDKTQVKFEVKDEKDTINILVKNGSDTQVGTIKVTDKEDQITVDANFSMDGMNFVLKADTTMQEVSKKKEYKGTTKLSLNVTQDSANVVSLTIDGTSNATKGADVKQNPAGAVDQNSLTLTDQQKLQENLTNLLIKLMS